VREWCGVVCVVKISRVQGFFKRRHKRLSHRRNLFIVPKLIVELPTFWRVRTTGTRNVLVLLLEEVLVKPAGGAHPVVCVGPNAPVY